MLNVLFHSRFWHRFLALAVVAAVFSAALAEDKQASKDAPTPINKPLSDGKPPKGFTALFNGKDLTGWHGMPHFDPSSSRPCPRTERKAQIDEVDRGRQEALDGRERRTGQRRPRRLPDHRQGLRRHRAADRLQDRVPRPTAASTCAATPQVQIWDYTKEGGKWNLGADKGRGGLWNNSPGAPGKDPLVLADKPFGEWNHFRILQVGERDDGLPQRQAGRRPRPAGELLRTARLPLLAQGADPAPDPRRRDPLAQPLRPRDPGRRGQRDPAQARRPRASRPSSTARTSPAGPARSTTTRSRTAPSVCKPKKGGTIYTKEEYGDFVARLEFKLPPGGNNGLAIRYPGKGDTAYVGMCELQVLDDDCRQVREARPAPGTRLGLRHGGRPARLSAAHRRVELRGSHRQGLDDQGRAERHASSSTAT